MPPSAAAISGSLGSTVVSRQLLLPVRAKANPRQGRREWSAKARQRAAQECASSSVEAADTSREDGRRRSWVRTKQSRSEKEGAAQRQLRGGWREKVYSVCTGTVYMLEFLCRHAMRPF